jgi:hypothetical protein
MNFMSAQNFTQLPQQLTQKANTRNFITRLRTKKIALVGLIACLILIFMSAFFIAFRSSKTDKSKTDKSSNPVQESTMEPTIKVISSPTLRPPTITITPVSTVSPTKIPTLTATPIPIPTNTPIPPTPTPVPPDTTPPNISSMTGPENNSTVNFNSFCFPVYITDDRSHLPNLWMQYQFDSGSWTSWSNSDFSPCFQNVANGSHTFSVQAKDEAGNISSPVSRTFTVQVP